MPEMPRYLKEALREAFYYKDTDEVIHLNKVWLEFIKQKNSTTLKG
jgi:hypothetical protein